MKTSNQQTISNLENKIEQLQNIATNQQKTIEKMEVEGIWGEVKNRENMKFISEEIILYLDKTLSGRNYEIKDSEGSNS